MHWNLSVPCDQHFSTLGSSQWRAVWEKASISIEQKVLFEKSTKPGGYSQIQAAKKHLVKQSTPNAM